MWILRWVFVAIVVIGLVIFSLQNPTEVEVNLFGYQTPKIPVYLIVFFSVAAGLIVFLTIGSYHQILNTARMAKKKKENKQLQAEVERLSGASDVSENASDNKSDDGT